MELSSFKRRTPPVERRKRAMKKRFLTFFCAALSAATMTTGVYADTDSSTAPDSEELKEILEVAENKNKTENGAYTNDDGEEVEYQIEPADIDISDAIKVYNVPFITEDYMHIVDFHGTMEDSFKGKDYEYVVPYKRGKLITKIGYMKIGEDLETETKIINDLNISDKQKQSMLKTAAERAGKWYQYSASSADERKTVYLTRNLLESLLASAGITNIQDMKYFCGHPLRLWVKADNIEYILPEEAFELTKDENGTVVSGKIFTVADFFDILKDSYENHYRFPVYSDEESLIGYYVYSTTPVIKDEPKKEDTSTQPKKDEEEEENTKPKNNKKDDEDIKKTDKTETKKDENKTADTKNADKKTDIKLIDPSEKNIGQDKFFNDVPPDHWAYDDIVTLAKNNVILGYGNNYFGVNDSVTNEQLAILLKRQFDYDEKNTSASAAKRENIIVSLIKALNPDLSKVDTSVIAADFSDGNKISDSDKPYIAYAVENKIVLGDNGKLNLENNVTRAETAALISRALKLKK